MRRSAVNDGSCSPWVMCSCSVVRGNQIHDSRLDMQKVFSQNYSSILLTGQKNGVNFTL